MVWGSPPPPAAAATLPMTNHPASIPLALSSSHPSVSPADRHATTLALCLVPREMGH